MDRIQEQATCWLACWHLCCEPIIVYVGNDTEEVANWLAQRGYGTVNNQGQLTITNAGRRYIHELSSIKVIQSCIAHDWRITAKSRIEKLHMEELPIFLTSPIEYVRQAAEQRMETLSS